MSADRLIPPLTDRERDVAATALVVASGALLVLVVLGLGMTRPSRRRIAAWERRIAAETKVFVRKSNELLKRRWDREDAWAAAQAAETASPAETGDPACP